MKTIQQNEPTRSQIYKVAKEVCGKESLTDLTVEEQHKIGQRLLYMCFAYNVSSDITEQVSYGYGELDNNGFWEFPINEQDIKAMKAGTL